MTSYSLPSMIMENEFVDLAFVGRYVDSLIESTGDLDYAIVYEWGSHGPGPYPPLAVLARIDGRWWRREVRVSIIQDKNGKCEYQADLEKAEPYAEL